MTTTPAPGAGGDDPTPWWLAEMIDRANLGRGRYEIAIPVTVLEDWIANIRPVLAEIARLNAASDALAARDAGQGE